MTANIAGVRKAIAQLQSFHWLIIRCAGVGENKSVKKQSMGMHSCLKKTREILKQILSNEFKKRAVNLAKNDFNKKTTSITAFFAKSTYRLRKKK